MIYGISYRIIAAIVAVLVALFVIWAAFHFYEKSRSQGAQARVERAQTGAMTNSAADAVNTVGAAGQREAASEELTRSNEEEIRNAPGASDPVNPAARDAGFRALCLRRAYRDDPKCKLLHAPSR